MKKIFFILIMLFISLQTIFSQTMVSGGIYSNTNWTKANSPYIVTGNIVVFPNVILTIEPGVIIKFNNTFQIEVRQSQIIAEGTSTDSITFTSNSTTPTAGIWGMIYFNQCTLSKFSYCKFEYANNALNGNTDYLLVKNSTFSTNNTAIYSASNSFSQIDSCIFKHNTVGINWNGGTILDLKNSSFISNITGFVTHETSYIRSCVFDSNSTVGIQKESGKNDTVCNNIITNNGIGYFATGGGGGNMNYIIKNTIQNNNIGINIYQAGANQDAFYCNTICNNYVYNHNCPNHFIKQKSSNSIIFVVANTANTKELFYGYKDR